MRRIIVNCFVTLLMLVFLPGPMGEPAHADELISALKLQAPIELCGEEVPIDKAQVVERFEKEMLLFMGNRPQLILYLKRAARYFPYIEQMLGQHGLPNDIKFLAVAESALRMHAGSRKGAMGVWQLMPQTARKYGLRVDTNFDERRNVYLSTPGALAYLSDLYDRFGSWTLSLAAYNMGEEGLEAEMLEQGVTDFYRLYLPLETQRFIFRILAIKLIFEAPQTHGVKLAPEDLYAPERFSTVRVDAEKDLPLRLIAEAAETDFKTIKDLNPELRGHYLMAGTRMVNVPENGVAGFPSRLVSLIEKDVKSMNQRLYVVKKGDSLSGIAKKFNVPVTALLIWNRIGIHQIIHPGQRLVVFSPSGDTGVDATKGNGDVDG